VLGTATAIEVKGSGKTETPAIATTAPFSVLQETTAVAGPVREDGTVDYVAAINENFGRGVTPENNGFVLWAQLMGVNATQGDVWDAMVAAGGIAAKPTEEGWVAYQNAREAQTLVAQVWKEGEHPELAAFLKEREKMLALAEEASRRERWWEPATSKNGVMGWIMLPELSPLVDVSRTLAARATLRAGQGDFDGFMRDVMTIKRLSRLVADWATINALVMIRIDELANEAIGTALGRGLFTREQCAKLAGELDALPPMKPMWETVNVGERWDNLDFVASMATGKLESWEGTAEPKYDERTRAFAAVDRGAVDWNAALKRMNAKFDEMGSVFKNPNIEEAIAAAKAFYKQAHDAAGNTQDPEALAKQPGETKEAYTERVVESVIAVRTTWPLWDAEMQYRGAVVQDDMARVVVALAGYRAEKGKWPEKLETLVPAYLKRVPWDPFSREATGAVVNYRVGSDGVLVYSVGPNGIDEDGENSGRTKGPDDITVGVNDPGTPAP